MSCNRKRFLFVVILSCLKCTAGFWSRNDSRVMEAAIPSPESMNQSLVVNLNYSPTQIKTPLALPDTLLSKLSIGQWRHKTTSFLYTKRYLIAVSVVCTGYIWACNYCIQAHKELGRLDSWANWHHETPMEEFLAIPVHELTKELILEIQRRYSNAQNPTDFLSPLITFVHVIDAEITKISQYLQVYTTLTKLHIRAALPINVKLWESLGDKQKRLTYLKNVFLTWAAEYKVSHNKNKAHSSKKSPVPKYGAF